LVLANDGASGVTVRSVSLEQGVTGAFSLEGAVALPHLVAAGEQLGLTVLHHAADAESDFASIRIATDEPTMSEHVVALSAVFRGIPALAVVQDPATNGPEVGQLEYGDVAIGAKVERVIYLKNTGTENSVLVIDEVVPSGAGAFAVRTSSMPPTWLNRFRASALCVGGGTCPPAATCDGELCIQPNGAPHDTVLVEVSFTPTGGGAFAGSLAITSNAAPDPHVVDLVGSGLQSRLQITPDPIDFGQLFIGYPAGVDVAVENVGNAGVTVTALSLVGASAGTSLSGGPPLPATVAPAASLQLRVLADPSTPGDLTGVLRVESTDPDTPIRDVALAGRVRSPPALLASPAAIDFGAVHVFRSSGASEVRGIEIENQGGSDLTVSSVGFSAANPDFTVSVSSLDPIPPGGRATVEVHYAPLAVGSDVVSLDLISDDPAQPRATVAIAGEAIDPTVSLSKSVAPARPASPIEFGASAAASPAVRLFVQNAGTGSLSVQSVALTAGSSADFARDGPALPASLAAGTSSLTFAVRYEPNGIGADSGTIRIVTDDRDAPAVDVALSGERTPCPDNRWDINNDPADGCEYTCTRADPPTETCNDADDDCDGDVDEGFDVNADVAHCGACNQACTIANGTPRCVSGQCRVAMCTSGWSDCNNMAGDGCEASLQDDVDTCGDCNTTCTVQAGSAECSMGACRVAGCNTGFDDCNTQYSDGCEADLTDLATCGSCSNACTVTAGTAACDAGQCRIAECNPGFDDCNTQYSDGCEANLSDPATCGAQCRTCPTPMNATATCDGTSCGFSCPTGFNRCASSCAVDVSVESVCDGMDDDCDNTADEGCGTGLCAAPWVVPPAGVTAQTRQMSGSVVVRGTCGGGGVTRVHTVGVRRGDDQLHERLLARGALREARELRRC